MCCDIASLQTARAPDMPTRRPAAVRWTREEMVVLFDCLRSEEFMGEHAPSLPRGVFPVISSREAGDKSTEKHALCNAIAEEILRYAGEHNGNALRPATSIATKILGMRSDVSHLPPEQALAAFDIDAFLGGGGTAKAASSGADADGDSGSAAAATGGDDSAAGAGEEDDGGAAAVEEDGDAAAAAAEMEMEDADADSANATAPAAEEPRPAAEAAAAATTEAVASGGDGGGGGGGGYEEDEYDDTHFEPEVMSHPSGEGRQIKFQTRILNQHLVCTICMGYFNDACTIIECLHTFCRVCIMRHFRETNYCPQCEKPLGANPKDLVRTDRTLQSIVDKVFPQFAKNPHQQKAAAAADDGDDGEAAADADGGGGGGGGGAGGADESTAAAEQEAMEEEGAAAAAAAGEAPRVDGAEEEGEEEEAAQRPRKVARQGSGGAEGAGSSIGGGGGGAEDEISFSLHELEGDGGHGGTPLEKPYLRTKALLTVGHLRKYLTRKMGLDADVPIAFFCSGAPLDSDITLDEIVRTVWENDDDSDLVLHYRVG